MQKEHCRWFAWLVAVSFLVEFSGQADAAVLRVPADFPGIQTAIDAAADGDEVVLDRGTYLESIDFRDRRITVRSSFSGSEPSADEIGGTIISGGTEVSVVRMSTGSRILGVSITKGRSGPGLSVSGGVVEFCWVYDNTAPGDSHAGGIAASSGAVIRNCRVYGNRSRHGSGVGTSGTVLVEDCSISGNTTFEVGGQVLCGGGGSPLFRRCVLSQPAVWKIFEAREGSRVVLDECVVENRSKGPSFDIWQSATVKAVHCTFVDLGSAPGTLINENRLSGGESLELYNCIAYNKLLAGTTITSFNGVLVYPRQELGGQIEQGVSIGEPSFENLGAGDYHLRVTSAAIGSARSLPPGVSTGRVEEPVGSFPDMGAFESPLGQPLHLVWNPPSRVPFGSRLDASIASASGSVAGRFEYMPPVGVELSLGVQTISCKFIPADSETYDVVELFREITVSEHSERIESNPPASVWRKSFQGPLNGTVAIDAEDRIYLNNGLRLRALDRSGNERWLGEQPMNGREWPVSPVIVNDSFVVMPGSRGLLAYDLSGLLLWNMTKPEWGDQLSTPAAGFDGTVYFPVEAGGENRIAVAISPEGSITWTNSFGTRQARFASPIVSALGNVIFNNWSYRILDTAGKLRAEYPGGWYTEGSPAVGQDDLVYGMNWQGKLFCIDQKGNEIWTRNIPAAVHGGISLDSEINLYVKDIQGNVLSYTATGSPRWQTRLNGASSPNDTEYSVPTLLNDGTLVVGSGAAEGGLYCLDQTTGSVLWVFPTPGRVVASPAIDSAGSIIFGDDQGNLFKLRGSASLADSAWPKYHGDAANSGRPRLILDVRSASGGSVASSAANRFHAYGEAVEIEATPEPFYSFVGWDGSLQSDANPLALTVSSNIFIYPIFRPIQKAALEVAQYVFTIQDSIRLELSASGDPESYTGSDLPPGLQLDPSGMLSGIPTAYGDYAATVVIRNLGGVSTNSLNIIVQKKKPSVTWETPKSVAIGTLLDVSIYNAISPLPGGFTYSPPLGTRLDVGTHKLKATFTPFDPDNYETVVETRQIIVTKLEQAIQWNLPGEVVLGIAPIPLSPAASSGLRVTTSVLSGPGRIVGGVLQIFGGGTILLRAVQSGNADYSAADSLSRSIEVKLRPQISQTGEGLVIREPAGEILSNGQLLSLTAIPGDGYLFSGWAGDVSSKTNPLSLAVTNNVQIQALFTQPWTLSLSNTLGGSVISEPATNQVKNGEPVTVIALPSEGHGFRGWKGSLETKTNPLEFVLETNVTLVAEFGKILGLTVNTAVGGKTTVIPQAGPYLEGDEIVVQAVPLEGYRFTDWSGTLSGSGETVTVTMTENLVVEPVFKKLQQLFLSQTGEGRVTLSGGVWHDVGETVTLEAKASEGWAFAGWEGSATGTTTLLELKMAVGSAVKAVFKKLFRLRVSSHIGGTVEVTPLLSDYMDGTVVSLTAKAEAQKRFDHWEGALNGSLNPTPFTITGDSVVGAVFRSSQRLIPSPTQNLSEGFRMSVEGEVGQSYVIETSVGLGSWTTLTTILLDTGPAEYVDKQASFLSRRFYRIRAE